MQTQPHDARIPATLGPRLSPAGGGAPPAGERPTFDALYAAYHAPVHSYIHRLMGNRDDADDLTQETFLKLYRALPRFRPGHVRGWVYSVATNACLDELRHRSLVRWQPWDAHFAAAFEERVARDDPARDALQEETRREVEAVLDRLPTRYRAAIVLREHYGLGYEEIASALGTTRVAVKALLLRARARFRQVWAGTHGYPPFHPASDPLAGGVAVALAG